MKTTDLAPTRLPNHLRETQRLLFIAKHARWTGGLHPDDGNHAPYHREMRETLEGLGMALSIADSYAALFDRPTADFVFPRSEEHTSELQSLMRISYAVFCLKKKTTNTKSHQQPT